jgi:hypothetical protein
VQVQVFGVRSCVFVGVQVFCGQVSRKLDCGGESSMSVFSYVGFSVFCRFF